MAFYGWKPDIGGHFFMLTPKKVVRCEGQIHTDHPGNILLAFDKNRIFVHCPDRGCGRWTRFTINVPGVELDFSDAGILQEVLPKDYHLHLEPATTVVGE
jgi:predicted unusual protein kinase regulating ubiquinone biosynthesis (AarF/ABC1/UbiB family)